MSRLNLHKKRFFYNSLNINIKSRFDNYEPSDKINLEYVDIYGVGRKREIISESD